VPLIVYGPAVKAGVDLGTRESYADLGQSIAELFGAAMLPHGTSFLSSVLDAPALERRPAGG
jgi:phosphopentomutase